ncbi:MAG TPA: T9SS type A sorting domain-containing protein, partial [Saprospiraceae bacterium]|nr:T9SS type A sorting domain-containing protein [Saprospiraceae bacterium]
DGGLHWDLILEADNLYANDIKFNPTHPDTILLATQAGLYRSEDGGLNWDKILDNACYDIEWKTNDPSIAFLVRNDPALNNCEFYKSSDYGLTWEQKSTGWFFSDLEGHNDGGARLAVTNADPNRVYAILIGEEKTGDDGFIGIYRSDDAGETWTLPNPPAGGPYIQDEHPCMVGFSWEGGYHQGFYNLGFDASDDDADKLLLGFMSLWYSTDGAANWTCFGGYCGNNFNYVHPDCQEIEINGDDVWMTSDGGIEYSNDFFETHYAVNNGITGSDFWGFGSGWNDDILVGGRYHNGNSGWYEDWLPGECLSLGGGEASTGYVNPGEGRKTYFSDIGGVVLPEAQNGYAQYFSIGKYPNESYYDAESGEIEYNPLSWNTFYVTNENKIWITENGGASFDTLHEFGTDINARAMSFEISRSNPLVMYLFQRDEYTWDPGLLWKTTDGGQTWNQLPLPPGYARRCVLGLSAEDENRVWLAYPDGGENEKIFTSNNGGLNWTNLTTPALSGEHITYVLPQGGTDGGLYLGTFRTIWFKDDHMVDWLPYNDGLPVQISTCILRPFYRDHKIRIGAYGKSIWEAPFAVNSRPVAQPMVNKFVTDCPGDTIQLDDYSMLSHEGATWEWSFPGGEPSTSSLRNPEVVYHNQGQYDVSLTVTNSNGTSTKTISNMITVLEPIINPVPPDIDFSSTDHFTINNPDDGITWKEIILNGCDENGDTAYYVDNYNYSSYGQDEIILPINMDLTQIQDPKLHFMVAYAPYYDVNAFIDSLKVLISDNCQQRFDVIFRSGGEALSTTTSGLGPNNLYEYDVFTPASCEEWRSVELDLKDYEGQYVTIKFLNQSGYGNLMYLDDIGIEGVSVGTLEVYRNAGITIYPNPTSGEFSITYPEHAQAYQLEVLNILGQVVFEKKTSIGKERINMNHQPPGTYYVKVTAPGGQHWVQKLTME